jgi:D-alanyl-D-alanine endopeptidase (penicillin-binding protein 7)
MRRLTITVAICCLLTLGLMPPVLAKTAKVAVPVLSNNLTQPTVSAAGFIVVDKLSGKVLAENNADAVFRLASLTKLMTVNLVLARKIPLARIQPIVAADQVGGSRLGVKVGTKFTVSDLLYATLLPSANDAANALADSTKLTRPKFVAAMNATAKALGLKHTVFTEPTGIDDGNVSTAREFARLAQSVFGQAAFRRYDCVAKRTIYERPSWKKIVLKNSDHLLTKPQYDDVLVSGGKTGYLGPDGGWNLAVELKSAKGAPRELTIVLMGEPMLAISEADAHALAHWAWTNYNWK